MDNPTETARLAFVEACTSVGTDPTTAESVVLSVGLEFLPPCARAVIADRNSATVEYWQWLTDEVAAGAEEDGSL
jgi:hypothetical protein